MLHAYLSTSVGYGQLAYIWHAIRSRGWCMSSIELYTGELGVACSTMSRTCALPDYYDVFVRGSCPGSLFTTPWSCPSWTTSVRVGGCLNEVSLGHYEPVCARSGFHTFFSTRVLGAPTGSTGTRLPVHTTS